MTGKRTEPERSAALEGHPAVRDPDALPIEIHLAASGVAGGFFRTRAGKKRPVEHGQFRYPEGFKMETGKRLASLSSTSPISTP
jgi:hypothetical protein